MPSDVCPHDPHQKQREFLWLSDVREVLYGGAAGGGKTDALLMAALQYTDVPNYSAVIFRRTYPMLAGADGPIMRAREWLAGTPARWKESERRWMWPNGAMLKFSHLENDMDLEDHQGQAYQFVGFDELTQFTERQYRYLFSRQRRLEGSQVPLRMRSASNPGGTGHLWVKKRFIDRDDQAPESERQFVPARLVDNPSLDQDEYVKSLSHLDPVTRQQLLNGDWTIGEEGRIKREWLCYYGWHGEHYQVTESSGTTRVINPNDCLRIITVDPAGTSKDVEIAQKEDRHSWSVVSVFDYAPRALIWRDLVRMRCEIPDLMNLILQANAKHRPAWVGVEYAGLGIAVCQSLARTGGISIRELHPEGKDKLTRAATALNMLERGEVYLPRTATWLKDLEDELLTWTGNSKEQADQIDTLAYAAMEAGKNTHAVIETAPIFAPWIRR